MNNEDFQSKNRSISLNLFMEYYVSLKTASAILG